ncbi:MAG: aminotransferase class III-fold pyridoxal phosphate-dependent enzyme, partial [Rhodospirillales bacterium]|nr:aminotransferase class III-fold pyridoxal phosphate-dependent enzyme [Rhodospirillales bacterium]
STFGGNPMAMAAANAVLDILLADGFLENVRKTGGYLRQKLEDAAKAHPKVLGEVRGEGMLLGVAVEPTNLDMVKAMEAKGLLTVPAGGNVIRFIPPLVVTEGEIDEAIEIFDAVCRDFEGA